jgi:transposase
MKELKIRKDRTPAVLRQLAKDETDARVTRRILAIANALSGMNRAEAASSAGMDRQTLRDWVIRYNAHGVAGLVDRWAGGRPATSMGRLLRRLGLTRQKPRPNHPLKDPAAEAAFKKSPARAKKHSVYA